MRYNAASTVGYFYKFKILSKANQQGASPPNIVATLVVWCEGANEKLQRRIWHMLRVIFINNAVWIYKSTLYSLNMLSKHTAGFYFFYPYNARLVATEAALVHRYLTYLSCGLNRTCHKKLIQISVLRF
jgi:hypothetical protein